MIEQAQNDQFLLFVYFAIIIVIPAIVLWFDDGKIHANQKA